MDLSDLDCCEVVGRLVAKENPDVLHRQVHRYGMPRALGKIVDVPSGHAMPHQVLASLALVAQSPCVLPREGQVDSEVALLGLEVGLHRPSGRGVQSLTCAPVERYGRAIRAAHRRTS
jgi:hypothetical protein